MKHILISLMTACLLAGCTEIKREMSIVAKRTSAASGDSVIRVCLSDLHDTIQVPLSDWIDDLEIITLEDTEDAYFKYGSVYISDHYLLIGGSTQNPMLLFNRQTGKFISRIGNIGNGPGEYFAIYSVQIDEPNNRIYMLPWSLKQIYVFDLNGVAYEPIKTPYTMPKGCLRVSTEEKTLIIGVLPFEGNEGVAVWKQDFDGNVLSKADANHLTVVPDFSNEVCCGGNVSDFSYSLFTWTGRADSLYHFDDASGRLIPVFTINTQSSAVAESNPYQIQINEEAIITYYQELPDKILANVSSPTRAKGGYTTKPPQWLYVDKNTLQGGWFTLHNDFLGNSPIYPNFLNGYFIQNYEPITLYEELGKALENDKLSSEQRQKVESFRNSINTEGNNIILIGKIK